MGYCITIWQVWSDKLRPHLITDEGSHGCTSERPRCAASLKRPSCNVGAGLPAVQRGPAGGTIRSDGHLYAGHVGTALQAVRPLHASGAQTQ